MAFITDWDKNTSWASYDGFAVSGDTLHGGSYDADSSAKAHRNGHSPFIAPTTGQ